MRARTVTYSANAPMRRKAGVETPITSCIAKIELYPETEEAFFTEDGRGECGTVARPETCDRRADRFCDSSRLMSHDDGRNTESTIDGTPVGDISVMSRSQCHSRNLSGEIQYAATARDRQEKMVRSGLCIPGHGYQLSRPPDFVCDGTGCS